MYKGAVAVAASRVLPHVVPPPNWRDGHAFLSGDQKMTQRNRKRKRRSKMELRCTPENIYINTLTNWERNQISKHFKNKIRWASIAQMQKIVHSARLRRHA